MSNSPEIQNTPPIYRSTEFPEGSPAIRTVQTTHTTTNAYQPSSSQATLHAIDSESLYEKERNLMRWEEELRARELHLNNTSQAATATAAATTVPVITGTGAPVQQMGPANFPAFHPVTRIAVSEDIPVANQRLVKFSYVAFLWTTVSLVWNFVCGIAVIIYSSVGDFFMSLFYLLIGIPITFFMTRRLYRAAYNQKQKASYSFILGYFCLLCFSLMFFIGFKHSGMHGLLWMISLFHNDHTAVGALHVVALFFWFVNFFLIAGIFFKALRVTYAKRTRGEMDYGFRQYVKTR